MDEWSRPAVEVPQFQDAVIDYGQACLLELKLNLRKKLRNSECCGHCIVLPVVGTVLYPPSGRPRIPRGPARFAPRDLSLGMTVFS